MTTPRRDDPERDRWLAEALRHAPDADAAPPSALSDQILRAARNAVKAPVAAARPAPNHPLAALWSWLARPPVAAGFASVMVAVLVGVMWWDQPLDATLPPRVATANAPAPAPAPEPAAPTAPTPARTSPPALESATAAAQAEVRAKDAAADRMAAAPSVVPAPAAARAPSPNPQSEQRVATERATQAEARKRSAEAPPPSAPEQEAPSVAAAPPPAPASPQRAAPAPFAAAVPAPAPAPAPPVVADSAGRARDEAAAEPRAAAGALAKSAAPLARRAQNIDARAPLGVPLERWSWRRDAEPRPMTRALQHWLADLDRAARWQPATTVPPADATTLRLSQDGAPHTTLALGTETVWLTPAHGAPLSAPLGPAAAAALRDALLAATP